MPLYIELPGGIFQKNVAIESRDISVGGLAFDVVTPPYASELVAEIARVDRQLERRVLPRFEHVHAHVVGVVHDPARHVGDEVAELEVRLRHVRNEREHGGAGEPAAAGSG